MVHTKSPRDHAIHVFSGLLRVVPVEPEEKITDLFEGLLESRNCDLLHVAQGRHCGIHRCGPDVARHHCLYVGPHGLGEPDGPTPAPQQLPQVCGRRVRVRPQSVVPPSHRSGQMAHRTQVVPPPRRKEDKIPGLQNRTQGVRQLVAGMGPEVRVLHVDHGLPGAGMVVGEGVHLVGLFRSPDHHLLLPENLGQNVAMRVIMRCHCRVFLPENQRHPQAKSRPRPLRSLLDPLVQLRVPACPILCQLPLCDHVPERGSVSKRVQATPPGRGTAGGRRHARSALAVGLGQGVGDGQVCTVGRGLEEITAGVAGGARDVVAEVAVGASEGVDKGPFCVLSNVVRGPQAHRTAKQR
mmetsp:Transcript_45996/g.99918  ORF Transcript_45996/g.99918 Transcript_45996/m.99918 type:complete len:353 (+) Transcript_45996:382-1440(+)